MIEIDQQRRELQSKLREVGHYPVNRFSGRGIVVCAGGANYFTNVFVLMHILRRTLRCELPVEVWYFGPEEMSPRMLALLKGFAASPVNATDVPEVAALGLTHGWQLKAAALMWSSFADVILLDADQVPRTDPADIFDWPQFQKTGFVLWPDVIDLVPENPMWKLCELEPRPHVSLDSGQVAVNKAQVWRALDVVMHFNRHAEFYYRSLYGDKDTFLFGALVTETDFSLVDHRPFSDGGLCLYQRRFDGEIIFQHRTGAKWRYQSRPMRLPGFEHQEACEAALSELRAAWNGLVFNAPQRSALAMEAEAQIAAHGAHVLVCPGETPILLELHIGGDIGRGRSPDRMCWHCAEENGSLHLVVHSALMPTWRFAGSPDTGWRGQATDEPWRIAELLPLALAPEVQTSPTRIPGCEWPFSGLYAAAEQSL